MAVFLPGDGGPTRRVRRVRARSVPDCPTVIAMTQVQPDSVYSMKACRRHTEFSMSCRGPRPRSGRCNSRGSRGRVQRADATRGTAGRKAPTAERSHRQFQGERSSLATPVGPAIGISTVGVDSLRGGDATAPRSARVRWGFRGSRVGSLHSPARPTAIASTAPRSRTASLRHFVTSSPRPQS